MTTIKKALKLIGLVAAFFGTAVLINIMFGCAMYQEHIDVPTAHYGHNEIKAYRMAMAHVTMVFPDFDFDRVTPLDNLIIISIRKGTGPDFCGYPNTGCFNPVNLAIFYEKGDQYTLMHEMVHYILWWHEHPETQTYHPPWPWHFLNHNGVVPGFRD